MISDVPIDTSRLIIKNLPKRTDDKDLRKFLKDFEISDIKLIHKQDGTFRGFAFVGVPSSDIAKLIIKTLNNTYFRTSRVSIEPALPVGKNKNNLDDYVTKEEKQQINDKTKRKVGETASSKTEFENQKTTGVDEIFEIAEEDREEFEEFLKLHNVDPNKMKVNYIRPKNIPQAEDEVDNATLVKVAENTSGLVDSGRLFVRNLPFICAENDLEDFFGKIGPISEVYLPKDPTTLQNKGFGYISYESPSDAVQALNVLDGHSFMGRVLHIMPADPKPISDINSVTTPGKKSIEKDDLERSWNTLFLGTKTTTDIVSKKLGVSKQKFLKDGKISAAVKLAVGETDIVNQTKEFLLNNGVCLEAFNNNVTEKSKDTLIVKNLPSDVTLEELKEYITTKLQTNEKVITPRIVLPPFGVSAILAFDNSHDATRAFKALYFSKFRHLPFLIEYAPVGAIKKSEITRLNEASTNSSKQNIIYVKNLNFKTTEDSLKKKFEIIGPVVSVNIAKSKPRDSAEPQSLGFGFVEFSTSQQAREAIKILQHSNLDGHSLVLKISEPKKRLSMPVMKEQLNDENQEETIIIVKNLPFEAKLEELEQLFRVYGRIKKVRLPKKLHQKTDKHRGFAFVEFFTREEAEKAFNALRFSTHLYGRRLVLDWANRMTSLSTKHSQARSLLSEPRSGKRKKSIFVVDDVE